MPVGSLKIDRFDFWFCFALESAALLAMLLGAHLSSASSLIIFLGASALYAAITAAIVGWLAPSIGVTSFLLFEGLWRGKQATVKKTVVHVVVAVGIGILAAYITVYFALAVTGIHDGVAAGIHPATLPRHHVRPSVRDLCSISVLEEILNRAIVFVALVGLIRWAAGLRSRRSEVAAIWTANILQALIFGAAHVFTGKTLFLGRPWYVRLLLSTQTWDGLILGWLYWRYGLESAIACHAASDLSLLAILKGRVRLT